MDEEKQFYTKDDAIMFSNILFKRIQEKDLDDEKANKIAWDIREIVEKYDLI